MQKRSFELASDSETSESQGKMLTRSRSRKLPVYYRPNPTRILLLPIMCMLNISSFLVEHRKFNQQSKNRKQIVDLLLTNKTWNNARNHLWAMCNFKFSREIEVDVSMRIPCFVASLQHCTALQYLQFDYVPNLDNVNIIEKILAFQFPVLKVLRVSQFNDLSCISHLQSLTKLDCSQLHCVNLNPITNLTKLVFLEVHKARELSDISAVANLRLLKVLRLSWCTSLIDISPCFGLTNLSKIDVACCFKLSSPSFLTAIVNLQEVQAWANPFLETAEYKRVTIKRPSLRVNFLSKGWINQTFPY